MLGLRSGDPLWQGLVWEGEVKSGLAGPTLG